MSKIEAARPRARARSEARISWFALTGSYSITSWGGNDRSSMLMTSFGGLRVVSRIRFSNSMMRFGISHVERGSKLDLRTQALTAEGRQILFGIEDRNASQSGLPTVFNNPFEDLGVLDRAGWLKAAKLMEKRMTLAPDNIVTNRMHVAVADDGGQRQGQGHDHRDADQHRPVSTHQIKR